MGPCHAVPPARIARIQPRWPVTLALWICTLATSAAAQETGGALEGRVMDDRGAPLAEVKLSVSGNAMLGVRTTVSDAHGRFRLSALPVGSYRIECSRLGYRAAVMDSMAVALGRTADVGEIRLPVEAIALGETAVSSPRVVLRTRSTPLGGTMTSDTYRGLPSDRDYQSVVTLMPHASFSYFGDRANLAGTSGPESNYYVDGADVVEPPGNAVSTSLPYNFVEAVEVRAGGYPAEFGGAGGGIVNAVTSAGGDRFHGQAFGFLANRQFSSFGAGSPLPWATSYGSWDAGFGFGGPLVADRMWYFVAYDPVLETADIELPGFGTRQDSRQAQRFAGKLSARLDDRTRVALSMTGDPTTRDQVGGVASIPITALGNIDPVLGNQIGGGANASLNVSRVLGQHAILEAAYAATRSRYTLEAATPAGASQPLYMDARTGYVEGGFGSATQRHAGRSEGRIALTFEGRGHAVKLGAEYADEYFNENLTLDQITRTGDSTFTYLTLNGRYSTNHMRTPTAYLQDSWRVSDNWRLDAGLRWSDEYWMASGGGIGQRVPGQWQPRAGVSWSAQDRALTRFFGSIGRYDQRTRLNLPGFFLQDQASVYLIRTFTHDPRSDPSGGTVKFPLLLGHQPQVSGLRGAEYDELEGGIERDLIGAARLVLRGVYRRQRNGVVATLVPSLLQPRYGNPGEGLLSSYPEVSRVYQALEATLEREGSGAQYGVSYILGSLRGNYEGYWAQSPRVNDPLGGAAFMATPAPAAYAEGPLPGDRRHQFKAWGSSPLPHRLSVGATAWFASGTPISEFGATPFGPPYYQLLAPRGSLGRTPWIYDVNLRLALELPAALGLEVRPRLLADAYHVGNPRRTVVVDQVHYQSLSSTGQQSSPNPDYGKTLVFQPAVAYRFGVEVSW